MLRNRMNPKRAKDSNPRPTAWETLPRVTMLLLTEDDGCLYS